MNPPTLPPSGDGQKRPDIHASVKEAVSRASFLAGLMTKDDYHFILESTPIAQRARLLGTWAQRGVPIEILMALVGKWWESIDRHTFAICRIVFFAMDKLPQPNSLLMDEAEKEGFEELPEVFTAWRCLVTSPDDQQCPLAFYESEKAARANTYATLEKAVGQPLLMEARVHKKNCALKLHPQLGRVILCLDPEIIFCQQL